MGAVIGQDDLGAGEEVETVVVGNAFRCPIGQKAFYRRAQTKNRLRCSREHDCRGQVCYSVTEPGQRFSKHHAWVQGRRVLWISLAIFSVIFTISYTQSLTGHFSLFASYGAMVRRKHKIAAQDLP